MRYAVYQIKVNDTNKASEDAKVVAMLYADAEPGLRGNFYEKVAEIEADDMEQVFDIGNAGPEHKITRLGRMHSVSVGDIIQDADGVRHVVAGVGFRKLEGSFD